MTRRLLLSDFLCILILVMFVGGGAAQSSSSASANASSVDGLVDVRLGGFIFETGARVALEFMRDDDADCFRSNVTVLQLQLVDGEEEPIDQVIYEPAVDIATWLGRIQLSGSDGQPLPAGSYSLVVTTSVGSFAAEIEVTDTSRFDELGRYSVTAAVCGLSLRVYRLLTEDDDGAHVALRVGDRLLVALEGNPTTGYEWSNTLVYKFATLREIGEAKFRPDSELVGAGGLFLFRYEAFRIGPQAFRFAYQRPWESVEPLQLVEISVDVH